MSLITLLLLLAFTALYLSKSIEKKPDVLVKFVDKMTVNLDAIALGGIIYAAFAALMALMISSNSGMLIRLIANVALVVMALPFTIDKLAAKFEGKLNPAIITEANNWGNWIKRNDKYVGYASAVISLLLFLTVFK